MSTNLTEVVDFRPRLGANRIKLESPAVHFMERREPHPSSALGPAEIGTDEIPTPCLGRCRMIDLPKISDPRGSLTFVEGGDHVSFEIKRVFYLYDVPGGANRGGHALKTCHQFLIAMSGSFDVTISDGKERQTIHLNRSYYGLYVPPMIWREIDNFSSGSVCLTLASEKYDPTDYCRDYKVYLRSLAPVAA